MDVKITKKPSHVEVQLSGHIDEDAKRALATIEAQAGDGPVVIDCDQVAKINSVGIKDWILSFDRIDKRFETSFARCPMAFIDVAMMVPSFLKNRRILSFYSCFHCEPCKIETPILIDAESSSNLVTPIPPSCGRCGLRMENDEDIEAELEFLRERNRARRGR